MEKSGYLVGGGGGEGEKMGVGGFVLGQHLRGKSFLPNLGRKQFSPQFGEKIGDKSGEGVLMMGNYPFALPLFIYLFFIFFFLFCLVCYCATLVGWCCFASFLYIYIYQTETFLFYFIIFFVARYFISFVRL